MARLEEEITMRRFTVLMFVASLTLAGFLSITSAFAQSPQMVAEISHDFTVGARTLPAGRYLVGRALSGDPRIFLIQNVKTGERAVVVSTPSEADRVAVQASL